MKTAETFTQHWRMETFQLWGEPLAKLQRAFEKCDSSKFSFCCAVDLLCGGIDAGIDSWFLFTFLLVFRFVGLFS